MTYPNLITAFLVVAGIILIAWPNRVAQIVIGILLLVVALVPLLFK